MRVPGLLAAALLFVGSGALTAQALPEGVTPAMVASGETLFKTVGLCFACHGVDAKGIQGVGANLTDDEWYHGDGTYEHLVNQILEGVNPQDSRSGVMMPPKGGSQINEEQAHAIAGYVWSLSHGARAARPGG